MQRMYPMITAFKRKITPTFTFYDKKVDSRSMKAFTMNPVPSKTAQQPIIEVISINYTEILMLFLKSRLSSAVARFLTLHGS